MNAYPLTATNQPERGQRQIEPILMRVTREIEVSYVPLAPVRFTPSRFAPITCTAPMVYGVNDSGPRVRMRRDAQLTGRRTSASRYQPIT